MIRTSVIGAVLACAGVCACGTKASGPSTWSYSLDFGSVAAAVSVDTVEIAVFDGTTDATKCETLVQKRRSKAELPKAVSTASSSVCDLASGKTQTTVNYGTFRVLAVAKRQGQDWFIGCNTQYVTRDEDPGTLAIALTNFGDNTIVAGTACQTVTDHCNGACQ